MSAQMRRKQMVARIVYYGFALALGVALSQIEPPLEWRIVIVMITMTAFSMGFIESLISESTPPQDRWNFRLGVVASLAAFPTVGIGFVLASTLTWYQWIALIIAVGAIIAMTEGMRRRADRRADGRVETSHQADESL